MMYRLVKGTFRLFYTSASGSLRSGAPDGDSIWFRPNNPKRFDGLGRRKVRYNKGDCVQLRFEGVDALELHYQGLHQRLADAAASRDLIIEKLGFGEVTYGGGSGMLARTAVVHPVPGYILTNGVDPHGRPISFVFAGELDKRDGAGMVLDETLLRRSMNGQLAASGQAYPMLYTSLPEEVREWLGERFDAARSEKLGVWRVDRTTAGTKLSSLSAVEEVALWPKFFRRVASWFRGKAGGSFRTWLASERSSDDVMLVDGEERRMSELIWERRGKVGMVAGVWGGVVVPR